VAPALKELGGARASEKIESQFFDHGTELGANFEKFREPEVEQLSLLAQLPIPEIHHLFVFYQRGFLGVKKKSITNFFSANALLLYGITTYGSIVIAGCQSINYYFSLYYFTTAFTLL